MIDHGARLDVVQQLGDLARGVVMVDVHRDGAGLEAPDDQLRVLVVVHDQRDAVLAALPALQFVAFGVGAESPVGQEVREPARARRHVAVGGPALAAHRHRAVGDDVGDGVDDVADGPFAHG